MADLCGQQNVDGTWCTHQVDITTPACAAGHRNPRHQPGRVIAPPRSGPGAAAQPVGDVGDFLGGTPASQEVSRREVDPDGGERWLDGSGRLHRLDGPAVTRADGTEEWWAVGRPHRVDGPAAVRADGTEEWWLCGWLHRVGGPAVTRPDGTEEWWDRGVRHRLDGPAVTRPDGTEEWWVRDNRHRRGGPAVTRPDGTEEWWVLGVQRRPDDSEWWVERVGVARQPQPQPPRSGIRRLLRRSQP